MGTPTIVIVTLSNTQQVISLLMSTNYHFWRMQMKSYLLGQGVFHFVDGLVPCPPSHVSNSSTGFVFDNQLLFSSLDAT